MNRPSTLIDCAEAIKMAKDEIREHIADGGIPASVRSFSELHDHIDANLLGGLCDETGVEWSIAHIRIVQDTVHAWLLNARHLSR